MQNPLIWDDQKGIMNGMNLKQIKEPQRAHVVKTWNVVIKLLASNISSQWHITNRIVKWYIVDY